MGQRSALARVTQGLGRIGVTPSLTLAEAEEAAQRCQPPGNRSLGVFAFVQGCQIAAQVERRYVARLRGRRIAFAQVVRQRLEVFAIALDRERRTVPLDSQVLQEP